MQRPTILASLASAGLDFARTRGVDPASTLAEVGLSHDELVREDARLPAMQVMKLWSAAATASGDPDFGLHAGVAVRTTSLGPLGYAIATSATVRDAFERCVRFGRVLDTAAFGVQVDDAYAWLRFRPGATRHYAEAIVASAVTTVRELTGRPVRPRYVAFEHPRPKSIVEHRRLFGVMPRFDHAAGNWVAFDADVLDCPCENADPKLAHYLDCASQAVLLALPAEGALRASVHGRILEALSVERVPMAKSIAKALGMTERTLHRRLRAEGATFRALLDLARFDLSKSLLRRGDLRAADIADRLGFSDPSVFSRAFRRWAGESPRSFWRALSRLPTART